jgi:hypothetical protein
VPEAVVTAKWFRSAYRLGSAGVAGRNSAQLWADHLLAANIQVIEVDLELNDGVQIPLQAPNPYDFFNFCGLTFRCYFIPTLKGMF